MRTVRFPRSNNKVWSTIGSLLFLSAAVGLEANKPASAENVNEIMFVLDNSGSISGPEFSIFRVGYVNAFNDITDTLQQRVWDQGDSFSVAVQQFSTNSENCDGATAAGGPDTCTINWTGNTWGPTIDNSSEWSDFITAFSNIDRANTNGGNTSPGGFTNIEQAYRLAIDSIEGNGIESLRRVIDYQTDGVPNRQGDDATNGGTGSCTSNIVDGGTCAPAIATQRDRAEAADIQTNGLGVGGDAAAYLNGYIVTNANSADGGNGGRTFFSQDNPTEAQFTRAITAKLRNELFQVPGPLPLFGAAAAFGYSRKIRRRISLR